VLKQETLHQIDAKLADNVALLGRFYTFGDDLHAERFSHRQGGLDNVTVYLVMRYATDDRSVNFDAIDVR